MNKRIHFYPFSIEQGNEYSPDEVKVTMTGTRIKGYSKNNPKIILHIPFTMLPYFVGELMKPYKRALKDMADIQSLIVEKVQE
jgi:hypothetical protein